MAKFKVRAEAANPAQNAGILSGCYGAQCMQGPVLEFNRDPNQDTVTCTYQASVAKAKVNFIVEAGGNSSVCAFRFFNPANPTATFKVCVTLLLAAILVGGWQAEAQTKSLLPFAAEEFVKELRGGSDDSRKQALEAMMSPDILREAFEKHAQRLAEGAQRIQAEGAKETSAEITTKRIDKQLGDGANGSGTTSLVSKAGSAGVAAEFANGALTRTQDGMTTTFRLNGLKFYELFQGKSIPTCPDVSFCAPGTGDYLKNFNLVATVDTTSADTVQTAETRDLQTGARGLISTLTKDRRLASWGGRYEFTRQQKATGEAWNRLMNAMQSVDSLSLTRAAQKVDEAMKKMDEYKAFEKEASGTLPNATNPLAEYERLLEKHIPKIYAALNKDDMGKLDSAMQQFIADRKTVMDNTLFRTSLSAEVTHLRPADKPEMVNFRFLLTKTLGAAATEAAEGGAANSAAAKAGSGAIANQSFSLNLAATAYTKRQSATIGHWRDVQAGLQWERKLGPARWAAARPAFALSGYYQYMIENGVIEFNETPATPLVGIPLVRAAKEVLDTKGHIGIAQAKLTIPLGTSGISIPVAVSCSNDTELIRKPGSVWRGQVGLSLDLDSLSKALK